MIVAFTGHRPDKLPDRRTGYDPKNPVRQAIRSRIREHLITLSPSLVISGMALGVDQDAAEVALELGIPVRAAVPFVGQERVWPEESKRHYREILSRCAEVITVCEGGYSPSKMQQRNEYMVDCCDQLIAVFDGTPGGTANCVRYAKQKGKKILLVHPREPITA